MALREDPAKGLNQLLLKIRTKIDPDITICCGDDEYRAHSLILEDVSPFFDKICNGPFKESQTRTINLVEDSPEAVKAFVNFLYYGEYDDEPENANMVGRWTYQAKVFYFARKYDIKALSKVAAGKFDEQVWSKNIKRTSAGIIADLIYLVYSFDSIEGEPDEVRDSVCIMFLSLFHLWICDEIVEVMKKHPEFTIDVLRNWHGCLTNGIRFPCPMTCGGPLQYSVTCTKCRASASQEAATATNENSSSISATFRDSQLPPRLRLLGLTGSGTTAVPVHARPQEATSDYIRSLWNVGW